MSHPVDHQARSQPRTPTRPAPQLMSMRNSSMAASFPSRSPEAHRQQLQRAHSLQPPGSASGSNGHGAAVASHQSPQGSPTTAQHPMASPPGASSYHFSPRHKRRSGADYSPATPRRMRRRLFFEDGMDSTAPEDRDRRRAVFREAADTALAIIREAVEVGDPHIDLSDLQLEAVPDELAELKDLVVLAPSHSMVTDLQLILSSNNLCHFPLAVCELANLTTLIISYNRISHLPPEIGNLVNLRELSVAHNSLRVLPLEITKLVRLETLSVFPNPFLEPAALISLSPTSASAAAEAALRKYLTADCGLSELRPFRLSVSNTAIPRLVDFAARSMSRTDLSVVKHDLTQCLESTRPPLGRFVGHAVEPTDYRLQSALRSQHLPVPTGHLCAACSQWFLIPPVELVVCAKILMLNRPVPLKVRLCGRNCLYSHKIAEMLGVS
ncbi:hypothetical protein IWW39_002612 [Coemansia spiralis]|uniref:Uncharacterized protein n=1 Tax=Coemansia spiralis TaxID=417178 RepID=A0A9W8L3D0_9FUNG|nr:hypothetical protein IWW39_002612 [Coemansia spiralis]